MSPAEIDVEVEAWRRSYLQPRLKLKLKLERDLVFDPGFLCLLLMADVKLIVDVGLVLIVELDPLLQIEIRFCLLYFI